MQSSEQLLTPAEIAQRLRVSEDIVMRAVRNGQLAAINVGSKNRKRLRPADVEEWIARGAPTSPPKQA